MRHASSLLGCAAVVCGSVVFSCGTFGSEDTVDTPAADASSEAAGDGAGGDSGSGTADGGKGGDAAADPGVFCGPTYCNPQTEVCCSALPNGGGRGCMPKAVAATCNDQALACDDNADCAYLATDGVCCGELGSDDVSVAHSNCYRLLNCKSEKFWVVICNPDAPVPCPEGRACKVPSGGAYGFCDGLHY